MKAQHQRPPVRSLRQRRQDHRIRKGERHSRVHSLVNNYLIYFPISCVVSEDINRNRKTKRTIVKQDGWFTGTSARFPSGASSPRRVVFWARRSTSAGLDWERSQGIMPLSHNDAQPPGCSVMGLWDDDTLGQNSHQLGAVGYKDEWKVTSRNAPLDDDEHLLGGGPQRWWSRLVVRKTPCLMKILGSEDWYEAPDKCKIPTK
jgi:hypothetical protein